METGATPEKSGKPDSNGRFSLDPNILGTNKYDSVKVCLVQIDFGGQVKYQWFNFLDVNFSFWNEQEIPMKFNMQMVLTF
jgi:hypothetical protein